jgi:DNA-binding PadR family transcriptional regulator
MLMTNSEFERKPRWRGPVKPRPVPDDFEAVFVLIGRLECEAHFRVGRMVIDYWLEQSGKDELIRKRAEHVTKQGEESTYSVRRYGRETVDQWRAESRRGLNLADMGRMLSQVFPVEGSPFVSPETARAAAQFLRIGRNGGFFVSPTGAGDWYVGLNRKSSAELVEMAVRRGFDAANLTGGGNGDVEGSAQ